MDDAPARALRSRSSRLCGPMGRLGGSVGRASDLGSGHNLTVCGFEPHVGILCPSKINIKKKKRLCGSIPREERPILCVDPAVHRPYSDPRPVSNQQTMAPGKGDGMSLLWLCYKFTVQTITYTC